MSNVEPYEQFLSRKRVEHIASGFDPATKLVNDRLFPWQQDIMRWACRRGRSALFLDTGLGKTAIELAWADACVRKTNKRALILEPLAVGHQVAEEAAKFRINDVKVCRDGSEVTNGITITNYERLHRFDTSMFDIVVPGESSILKSFDGKTRQQITEAFAQTRYKLPNTATPAPNDQMELGSHAEFVGAMSRNEMLSMFFVHDGGDTSKWRLRGHARNKFYQWMASWAVAIRKPGDIGYSNEGYDLPPLRFHEHIVESPIQSGQLFATEAKTLGDQRASRRDTIDSRVDLLGLQLQSTPGPWIVWCNLNDESKAATAAYKSFGAVEVTGSEDPDAKEEKLTAFTRGQIPLLVSKPELCGFGLNWQHCHLQGFLGVSHSWEQLYQAIRRSYRFGQKSPVDVHIVISEAEMAILGNLKRKQSESDSMNAAMAAAMGDITRCQLQKLPVMDRSYQPLRQMWLQPWVTSGW